MDTSSIQAAKLFIVGATGLSKDALHIHVGLGVYVLAALALSKRAHAATPLLIVVLLACVGETLDRRDDILSMGYWRWRASLHDVLNTSFWPAVLYGLVHLRLFFQRHK